MEYQPRLCLNGIIHEEDYYHPSNATSLQNMTGCPNIISEILRHTNIFIGLCIYTVHNNKFTHR